MLVRSLLGLIGLGMLSLGVTACQHALRDSTHWRDSRWDSALLLPPPTGGDATIMVFGARAYGWRGVFGIHTWIVWKGADDERYRRAEVVGWGVRRGAAAVRLDRSPADGRWAGNQPAILARLDGPNAAAAIPLLEKAIASYPFNDRYRIWPGPNSNTFTAHVLRATPGLRADLPPTAIGKDFIEPPGMFASAPSKTGFQWSLMGLTGVMLAVDEGLEVNLLGLTFGLDFTEPAIKLPGLGRLGLAGSAAKEAAPSRLQAG